MLTFLWGSHALGQAMPMPDEVGAAQSEQDHHTSGFNLQQYVLKQNIQLGVDHWGGNFSNSLTKNYLDTPNTGRYSDLIPWFKFSGSYLPFGNNDVRINIDYRYDKTLGGNLDQASLDFAVMRNIGMRLGVLPMRLNFCRTYEQDNPWIMEISTSCKYGSESIYRSTNAAPGAQVYLNSGNNDWMSSYQLGFYQPALLGYDKTEFGYEPLSATPFDPYKRTLEPRVTQTASNNKLSLSYDGLSPSTGVELKLGVLWAQATTNKPETKYSSISGYKYQFGSLLPDPGNTNRYQIFFGGIRVPINNQLSVTPTYNLYLGDVSGDTTAYYQFLPPYQRTKGTYTYFSGNGSNRVQNIGLELKYGFSNNSFLTAYFGTSSLAITNLYYQYFIDKKVATLAYRQDLESGFFYIVQGVYGWQVNTVSNVPTPGAGGFLGLRLGYLLH